MLPLWKSIKRYFSLRVVTIAVFVVTLVIAGIVIAKPMLEKKVVISDNALKIDCTTMKSTVKEVLEEKNIPVPGTFDFINLSLDKKLENGIVNEIVIKRAVPVYIVTAGKSEKVMSYKATVAEVLKDNSIVLGKSDRLDGSKMTDRITSGMKITIVKGKEVYQSTKVVLPHKIEKRANKSITKGITRTVQKGKDGNRTDTYKLVYENGKLILRKLVTQKINAKPVSEIIEYGTLTVAKTSRGQSFRYSKLMVMNATAYSSEERSVGTRTASGTRTHYGVVAVDRRVIPIGTRLYVEGYGYCVAEDTGVYGNKIDLYFNTVKECYRWGLKRVKVYILS